MDFGEAQIENPISICFCAAVQKNGDKYHYSITEPKFCAHGC